ncbi:YqiA/YcfP family alpha/beta fold hydrolase [Porticoccus sp. W117]|uniref:YqiA/YcfP family alpha/beta fold hydrolase n=1 Tax=Porticoccus sp. W117 TaxID=3054777 RepID=UPI0025989708|nr:YqiA/YcfP family alpha/beta fold hydrolase [Porticoccus sp. W117]MDM3872291.1 YqiA/YcfP family alpha/beta fold hydrolase [Porticoccus sp. W117]
MLLLYLHGFNSSPLSFKSEATRLWLKEHHPEVEFHCPQLHNYPERAIAQLEDIIVQCDVPPALAGSSMGGFFATYLAEKYALRATIINPAVRPWRGMHEYVGENANYHTGETWVMEHHHVEQYRQFDVETLQRPENLWALLQTEDEVLDYRDAEEKYAACKLTIEQGGDHGFQGYERFLPEIYQFLFDVRR